MKRAENTGPGTPSEALVPETLGIVGPGTLGLSLARWAARCGLRVHIAGRSLPHAQEALGRAARRWEAGEGTAIIPVPLERSSWSPCAWVLEATPEDPDLKASVLAALDGQMPNTACLLTGSSSLPVGALQQQAGLSRELIGFHLFVPVRERRVVEVVAPTHASDAGMSKVRELARLLGLATAQVADRAGYVALRMALVQGLEAIRLLEEGAASPEAIDLLMGQGYGHPCGPLELTDRIGLDLRLALADRLWQETGDPRFQAPELLRTLVREGRRGRKTGRGFFTWSADGRRT